MTLMESVTFIEEDRMAWFSLISRYCVLFTSLSFACRRGTTCIHDRLTA